MKTCKCSSALIRYRNELDTLRKRNGELFTLLENLVADLRGKVKSDALVAAEAEIDGKRKGHP